LSLWSTVAAEVSASATDAPTYLRSTFCGTKITIDGKMLASTSPTTDGLAAKLMKDVLFMEQIQFCYTTMTGEYACIFTAWSARLPVCGEAQYSIPRQQGIATKKSGTNCSEYA